MFVIYVEVPFKHKRRSGIGYEEVAACPDESLAEEILGLLQEAFPKKEYVLMEVEDQEYADLLIRNLGR